MLLFLCFASGLYEFCAGQRHGSTRCLCPTAVLLQCMLVAGFWLVCRLFLVMRLPGAGRPAAWAGAGSPPSARHPWCNHKSPGRGLGTTLASLGQDAVPGRAWSCRHAWHCQGFRLSGSGGRGTRGNWRELNQILHGCPFQHGLTQEDVSKGPFPTAAPHSPRAGRAPAPSHRLGMDPDLPVQRVQPG